MRRNRHRPLHRFPLPLAALCFGGLLGTAMAAQDAPTLEVNAQARDGRPQSRVEGGAAMDDAIAAALIGAVSNQFGERRVGVRLDRLSVEPASLRDRSISGEGRLRIGPGGSWIPFRFDALYDTYQASVSYPYLVIGASSTEQVLSTDSRLARALDRRLDHALAAEFAQQEVDLTLDHVTSAPAGERYLAVRALGTAAFAGEGSTAAQVQALYDRRSGEWLRVGYELGASADRVDSRATAVAVR